MNHESGTTHHGRAVARWLIGLGALFIGTWAPLEHRFWDQAATLLARKHPLSSIGGSIQAFGWYWTSPGLHGAFLLLLISPTLLFVFAETSPRRERLLLAAFVPLSGLLGCFARDSAYSLIYVEKPALPIPLWLAGIPPVAAAAGVLLAWASGARPAALAPWARRILAAGLLWAALLQWNRLHLYPLAFHVFSGALGASLILLGESLATRREP